MKPWSKILMFAVIFLTLCGVAGAAQPITVTVRSTPLTGEATVQCPHSEQITGNVQGPAGTPITYRFEGNTGNGPTMSGTIPSAGDMQVLVIETWTKGASGTYWAVLHLLTPTNVISNRVTFQVHCPGGI